MFLAAILFFAHVLRQQTQALREAVFVTLPSAGDAVLGLLRRIIDDPASADGMVGDEPPPALQDLVDALDALDLPDLDATVRAVIAELARIGGHQDEIEQLTLLAQILPHLFADVAECPPNTAIPFSSDEFLLLIAQARSTSTNPRCRSTAPFGSVPADLDAGIDDDALDLIAPSDDDGEAPPGRRDLLCDALGEMTGRRRRRALKVVLAALLEDAGVEPGEVLGEQYDVDLSDIFAAENVDEVVAAARSIAGGLA